MRSEEARVEYADMTEGYPAPLRPNPQFPNPNLYNLDLRPQTQNLGISPSGGLAAAGVDPEVGLFLPEVGLQGYVAHEKQRPPRTLQ